MFFGLLALMLGTLVYVTDRPPESAWLIETLCFHRTYDTQLPRLFGALAGNLPSFLHVFAFSLITAGVWETKQGNHAWPCVFWFAINSMFELGQACPDTLVRWIPDSMSQGTLMGRMMNFFKKGTFDPLDIFAFAAGALAAYALLTMMKQKEQRI